MGLSVLCVKLVKKIGGQRYNILFALTQWRDDGTLEAVFHALSGDADMENLSVDSTV